MQCLPHVCFQVNATNRRFVILPGVSTYLLVSMVSLLTLSKEKTYGAHTFYKYTCYSLVM